MSLYIARNVVDQNQVPVVGAEVYIRAGGVNASLEDASGGTITQPVVTVANGFFEVYSTSAGTHVLEFYWGGKLRYIETVSEIDRLQAIADAAEASAQAAAAFSGPLYANIADGLAGTSDGDEFLVDNGDGTGTIYLNDAGTESEVRTIILNPSNSGAAALIGASGGVTVQAALNARPTSATLAGTGGAALVGTSASSTVQAELDTVVGKLVEPDATDYPFSLYVGGVDVSNLVSGGVGHNVLIGQNILSSDYTGTDATNPDTGYGHVMIGTRIGEAYMTNNKDCVLIGYENSVYAGNMDNVISIGAKATNGDKTRATVEANPNLAPSSGVVIGLVAYFDGLVNGSERFVGIGNNVGQEQTRAFETVYIGDRSGRYLGDTLYNVAVGMGSMGGVTDSGATSTIHNVGIGWYCLGAMQDGTQNVVVGSNAGRGVTQGGRNVLIGHGAGSDLSTAAGAAGANALTIGDHCTLIGNETEVSGSNAQYQVAIGSGAAATKDNQTVIGDTGRDHEVLINGYTKTKVFATADLPSAATAGAGARAFVSDSDTAAASNFGGTFAGGGSNNVPVYSDGTDWRIG